MRVSKSQGRLQVQWKLLLRLPDGSGISPKTGKIFRLQTILQRQTWLVRVMSLALSNFVCKFVYQVLVYLVP